MHIGAQQFPGRRNTACTACKHQRERRYFRCAQARKERKRAGARTRTGGASRRAQWCAQASHAQALRCAMFQRVRSVDADRVQWARVVHDAVASLAAALSVVFWCIGSLGSRSRSLQPGSAYDMPLAGARAPAALNEGLAAAMIFMARKLVSATGKSSGASPRTVSSSPLRLHASSPASRARGSWQAGGSAERRR